jgi:hypothetical protein
LEGGCIKSTAFKDDRWFLGNRESGFMTEGTSVILVAGDWHREWVVSVKLRTFDFAQ